MRTYLAERGIGTGIHYPFPVHQQPAYVHLIRESSPLAVTEQVAGEILSLPLYPQLPLPQAEEIVGAIKEFLDGR